MKTVQKRDFQHVEHLRQLHMPLFAFLQQFSIIDDETLQKRVFFGMLNTCYYCICLYLRFWSTFQKLKMKTLQKRVFSACWTLAIAAYAFIGVSRANFKNWWWKQCKNAFFRHVEHLWLLHMPLFEFLEQISKTDDENCAKMRFFDMLNSCECCVCLILRFWSTFQKLMMKTV